MTNLNSAGVPKVNIEIILAEFDDYTNLTIIDPIILLNSNLDLDVYA